MHVLFVVQRYGADVLGGAEEACRQVATRLAARGHRVEVLTSCARGYQEWRNEFPPGTEEIDGVVVRRLEVARPRDLGLFAAMQGRVVIPRRLHAPPFLQREWMRMQGPWMPDLPGEVQRISAACDVTVVVTYLYWTAWSAVPAARSPVVLHPAAHDELPINLPIFDLLFRACDGFAFATDEEATQVRTRFRLDRPSRVVGLGVDLHVAGDVDRARRRIGLDDRPYLVCVGRVEPGKGSAELIDFFATYKRRHPGPLALVMVGEAVHAVPRHGDVTMAGYVDDATRDALLLGAEVLLQPSYFESFSLSLMQGWAARVPALVQSHSPVLAGHCRRSGAGIPYHGYAEFEVGLERLIADAPLRHHMGEAGRAYVESRYAWTEVVSRYEELLDRVATGTSRPRALVDSAP